MLISGANADEDGDAWWFDAASRKNGSLWALQNMIHYLSTTSFKGQLSMEEVGVPIIHSLDGSEKHCFGTAGTCSIILPTFLELAVRFGA